jgi:hypothetical protein
MKNLNKVRNEGLDKFYTNIDYAKKCIDDCMKHVNEEQNGNKFDLVIEPSAGCGNFFNQIEHNNKIGIDIQPDIGCNELIKMDFFKYIPDNINQKILVIGNPPFGRSCSIAIKFFNHAAQWADTIAFIIPRTFRKTSVQNKLNTSFHLMYDNDTPIIPCVFTPKMMVKCCFQIWKKQSFQRRIIILPTSHKDWEFLPWGPLDEKGQPTPPQNADFALRAYGGKIGQITSIELDKLRPKSWHWIKSNIDIKILISRFDKIDYSNSNNTARQNSMGRAEFVELYNKL